MLYSNINVIKWDDHNDNLKDIDNSIANDDTITEDGREMYANTSVFMSASGTVDVGKMSSFLCTKFLYSLFCSFFPLKIKILHFLL